MGFKVILLWRVNEGGKVFSITISHKFWALQVFSFRIGEKETGDLASTSDLVELLPEL